MTKTDRAVTSPPSRAKPYARTAFLSGSASSGIVRSKRFAKLSWLARSWVLMPHTVAPRAVNSSSPLL